MSKYSGRETCTRRAVICPEVLEWRLLAGMAEEVSPSQPLAGSLEIRALLPAPEWPQPVAAESV